MLTMIASGATSIFSSTHRVKTWLCTGFVLLAATVAPAREKDEAEAAARALAQTVERQNFEVRAEAWVKDLQPDIGRAVRVQLFKGNEYRFCVAVPLDSQVHISAAVLDMTGAMTGELLPVEDGWGCIVSYKPEKTGIYAVAVRQVPGGKLRKVACAVITAYR